MRDHYGREISYLRMSVTDLCNLRCRYCMPPEGVLKRCHSDMLSLEELAEVAREAVSLGIRKIRITGGEPLVRRGVVSLCRELAALPGLEELSLTTNGVLLPQMAAELKSAGVGRVNISLDTLDEEKYLFITRGGELAAALSGIRAAQEAGFTPLKLNTVLIGGFNDDEIPALCALTERCPIQMRFIELMPIGWDTPFGPEAYIPCSAVLERIPALEPTAQAADGVAAVYRLPGAPGTVGLIRPLSHHFCAACNRLRLTADGFLKPCLHSGEELSVRGLHGAELRAALALAISHKPARHGALSATERSEAERSMNRIGG